MQTLTVYDRSYFISYNNYNLGQAGESKDEAAWQLGMGNCDPGHQFVRLSDITVYYGF
jgi:hypothetical protein